VYKHLVENCGIDPRRIRPVGRGEAEPATWVDETGKTVVLTEDYINQFKADKAKYEMLHTINRRTTAKITSTTFDPKTAPVADPEYSKFKQLPRL
jgi:peptidoglycan-associated lipoprotein